MKTCQIEFEFWMALNVDAKGELFNSAPVMKYLRTFWRRPVAMVMRKSYRRSFFLSFSFWSFIFVAVLFPNENPMDSGKNLSEFLLEILEWNFHLGRNFLLLRLTVSRIECRAFYLRKALILLRSYYRSSKLVSKMVLTRIMNRMKVAFNRNIKRIQKTIAKYKLLLYSRTGWLCDMNQKL